MSLTVICTSINDRELVNTVQSIRDTAGDKPKLVLVDDMSSTPIANPDPLGLAKVIHNRFQCGVGPSRHIGVIAAQSDYVLLCDAHMRFTPGWYEALMDRLTSGSPTTVYCTTCLALQTNRMDPANPVSEYNGATLNVYGPGRVKPGETQVMEPCWLPKDQVPDNGEVPLVLGANYAMRRDWFLKLSALRCLRTIGSDEVMLSVKSWLAGGDCRLIRTVRIGHRFTLPRERQSFDVMPGVTTFNKLFCIHTLMPSGIANYLAEKLQALSQPREWTAAMALLRQDWQHVAAEQACNASLFVRQFRWFCERFGIGLQG